VRNYFDRSETLSKAYSGTSVFPGSKKRGQFFIVAAGTNVTCAVGSGGDPFTIPDGGHWNPISVPACEITLVGACVVTTNVHP
jgi:hypothetical protein